MELIVWFVIIPLILGSLLSGLAQSLCTSWGSIPILVDPGKVFVDHPCRRCLDATDESYQRCCRSGRMDNNFLLRLPSGKNFLYFTSRGRRFAGVVCCYRVVSL